MGKVCGSLKDFAPYKESESTYVMSYGLEKVTDEIYTWYEYYFYKSQGNPSLIEVKKTVFSDIDSRTDEKIVNGYVWNGIQVRLDSENQKNFSEAQHIAEITNGGNLPIKFKLNDNEKLDPIYYTFDTIESLTQFYVDCNTYIQSCITSGWEEKDSIDFSPFINAFLIRYDASEKLNVDLSRFTPAATAETYDSATQTGVIGFTEPVTEIGVNAFGVKYDLMSIELPNSVTTIGNGAFVGCTGLTSATIGNGVTSIGNWAFSDCTSLTSIEIPSGVTSIGNWAFSDCTSLTSITCDATTPPTLGNNAFANTNGCPIYVPCEYVETYKSVWSAYESRIQCVTPPQPTTAITYNADSQISIQYDRFTPTATAHTFADGVGKIEFSNDVTSIGNNAFFMKTALKNIYIPNTVKSIGDGAFVECTSLTSITIPSSVYYIGDGAFGGCNGFTSVTVNATTPPMLGNEVFNDTNNCPIYVPSETVEAYQTASGWSAYADRIQAMP